MSYQRGVSRHATREGIVEDAGKTAVFDGEVCDSKRNQTQIIDDNKTSRCSAVKHHENDV